MPSDPADLREQIRRLRLALTECAAELEAASLALRAQGERHVDHARRYRDLAEPD